MPEYRTTPQNIEDNRLYRYYRNQWLLAGTDNFTQPPAENQDMFESLLNILPPTNNVLQRRWGYRNFFPKLDTGAVGGDENFHAPPSTPVATIKARNLYSYENHTLNQRTVIGTAADATGVNSLTNNVGYWDVNGNFISIYTPAAGATSPRAVNSRDYEYFVDGVSGDQTSFNIANVTSKWGIVAPSSALSVAATSGSNGSWIPNAVFSTMGMIVDQNGNMEQLVSVNVHQTNTSNNSTTGVGQPAWNQTPGGTTSDSPVTWTNRGPIGLWSANHFFNEGHFGTGTAANPAIIYDNTTKALFFNNQGGGGTSGNVYPAFKTGTGKVTQDGTAVWEFLGFVETAANSGLQGTIQAWQPSVTYATWGSSNNFSQSAVVEPVGVIFAFNPLTNSFNQPIFLQSSTTGGTTPSTETNPFFVTTAGQYSDDNNIRWLCLGSATWPANTVVTAWAPNATNFTAIKDTNGNIQVCIQGGTTAGSAPTWALGYGHTTNETSGNVVWTNVGNGNSLSWTASTTWVLPANGFTAPQTPTAYGGISIGDLNNNLETVINSGKSGGSAPTWASVGNFTADGGASFPSTAVTVSGGSTTYTITGGPAIVGANFLATGFAAQGNNGVFNVVSSTTTTVVVNTTTQVTATSQSGTLKTGLIWFDVQTLGLGAGTVTLITPTGRRYYVVFLNTTKQNFSDLSPISLSTGPITNGQIALFNIPISADPQVNQKVILATSDGGNPNTLYFVGQIANTVTTFNDNTPDAQLVLGNVYAQIDNNGTVIGVIGNQPPPNGSFPILHKGRVYMIVGTQLFFSKALSEVTTSTGIIAGRFEEDWPLTYAIDFSPGAENGIGLLSDGYALYIGTEKHIRRLLGDGPLNFQQPNVIFSETGLMTQNVWKVVFLEGTPIGSMWVTPDFRVIGSDFNTYNDVGTPIQTTLNTINPNAVNNAWAESVTYGPYNFYVLAIPTGNNTDPDTVCVYDLHLRKWYIWQFADKFISGLFYISIAGTPRLLQVDNSGFVRFIDTTAVMDRNQSSETAVGIANVIKTAWLDLGDPSLRKTMNEIEIATSNTNTLVTIEGASNQADFTTPNIVIQNAPLVSNIFGQLKTFLSGLPAIYRYYRFTFTQTSTLSNLTSDIVLGYFSSEVLPLNRI